MYEELTRISQNIRKCVINHFTVLKPKPSLQKELERQDESLFLGFGHFSRPWLLFASFIIQLCLGTKYAWSLYNQAISDLLVIDKSIISPVLSITILFVGIGNFLSGPVISRNGPSIMCLIGSIIFLSGQLVSALGCHFRQLWIIYLGSGVLTGLGAGIAFLCPVITLHRYFPDRKGLASGFAVGGYGAGIAVASFCQGKLLELFGVKYTFVILGCLYASVQIPCALILRFPSENIPYIPVKKNKKAKGKSDEELYQIHSEIKSHRGAVVLPEHASFQTLKSVITHPFFYAAYLVIFFHQFSGILMLTRVADILKDNFSYDPFATALLTAAIGIFNAGGRIIMGIVCDWISPTLAFSFTCIAQIVSITIIRYSLQFVWSNLFLIGIYILIFCYGSGFAMLSMLLIEIFGVKWLDQIFGITLTAFALDGLLTGTIAKYLIVEINNTIPGQTKANFETYSRFFLLLYPFLSLGTIIVFSIYAFLKRRKNRIYGQDHKNSQCA